MMGISWLTGGALGMGDGILMLGIGSCLSVEKTVGTLFAGLFLAALGAGIDLFFVRRQKNAQFPLIPFFADREYGEALSMTEKGIAWSRGSLTVEMAGLMPAILLVVFGVISLCFYVHNKCFLTAGAYEAALSGTFGERPSGGGSLGDRSRCGGAQGVRGGLTLVGHGAGSYASFGEGRGS